MKDQYFGDENDFKKYGLLRMLAGEGSMRIAVCWLLTDADQSNNGNDTGYLQQSGKWRALDPPLFDSLRRCIAGPEERSVDWAKDTDLIPGALYYDTPLRDNVSMRRAYFERFLSFAGECDLELRRVDGHSMICIRANLRRCPDAESSCSLSPCVQD